MSTKDNPGCQIGSFVLLLIAFVAFLTAFISTYWMETGATHFGLWRACHDDICTSLVGADLTTVAFVSAQALFCIGLLCCVTSIGGHIAWVMNSLELSCTIAWTAQVASAFFTGFALILWGNESFRYFGEYVLSWSYWLMMAAAGMMAFTGGITGCKTACATRLKFRKSLVYSSTAARGATTGQYPPHDESDYSDITQSEYSLPNMGRPQPGWSKGAYPAKHRY